MSENHHNHVLELFTFKLKPSITEDEFISASESFSDWARRQPGFVSRKLSHSREEDTYVDVLYWESMAAAELASIVAVDSTECAPMFEMAEENSVKMLRAGPVTAAIAV